MKWNRVTFSGPQCMLSGLITKNFDISRSKTLATRTWRVSFLIWRVNDPFITFTRLSQLLKTCFPCKVSLSTSFTAFDSALFDSALFCEWCLIVFINYMHSVFCNGWYQRVKRLIDGRPISIVYIGRRSQGFRVDGEFRAMVWGMMCCCLRWAVTEGIVVTDSVAVTNLSVSS